MRIIKVKFLIKGLMIERPITDNDTTILDTGTILTDQSICFLREKFGDYYDVWVRDSVLSRKDYGSDVEEEARRYVGYLVDSFSDLLSASIYSIEEFDTICEELRKYLKTSRNTLSDILLLKDNHRYTYDHSINVAMYSTLVGLVENLSSEDLQDLIIGSILHDIGKVRISNYILDKPDKLLSDEFKSIKKHPIYGVDMVERFSILNKNIKDIILQHHEKLDGSGYPYNLKGSEVNELAKIVAVCDIFDAVTSERSYHKAKTYNQGVSILYDEVEKGKLEEKYVSELIQRVIAYPRGALVRLNDNKIYEVLEDTGIKEKPVLVSVETGKTLDMNERDDLRIEEQLDYKGRI